MFAAIRLVGKVGLSPKEKDTLKMLNLKKKYHCVVVPETDDFRGMFKKVKNSVTWGEINEEVLHKLLSKRGRFIEGEKIDSEEIGEIVDDIMDGASFKELELRSCHSLTPPSGGFRKKIKNIYPNGEAGYRGEKINELLLKMI